MVTVTSTRDVQFTRRHYALTNIQSNDTVLGQWSTLCMDNRVWFCTILFDLQWEFRFQLSMLAHTALKELPLSAIAVILSLYATTTWEIVRVDRFLWEFKLKPRNNCWKLRFNVRAQLRSGVTIALLYCYVRYIPSLSVCHVATYIQWSKRYSLSRRVLSASVSPRNSNNNHMLDL
jgi:hypothetical protein